MKKLLQNLLLIGVIVLASVYSTFATFNPTSTVTTSVLGYCQSPLVQTLNVPITVNVGSPNAEYVDFVSVSAPVGITISHVSPAAGSPSCGSGSTTGLYVGVATQTISWATSAAALTTPSGCGFWNAGAAATQVFTVQITIPANYNSPIALDYNVRGDGWQCASACNCVDRSCLTGTFTLSESTPSVTASATPNPVCGGSTTLNGGGASTYTWTDGVNTPANGVAFTPAASSTYTVTGTSAIGCTATSTVAVNVQPAMTTTITQSPTGLLCGVNPTLSAVTAGGGGATPPAPGARYYIRDTDPWSTGNNTTAMTAVFGAGNYTALTYVAATPATIFVPSTQFVFLEGSDANAASLNSYITTNITSIENWVNAGGRLFLNAAPNGGSNMTWGFGGVILNYNNAQANVTANAAHPIVAGPFLPTGTAFTGGSYSHAHITGGATTPIITGGGFNVLTEKTWGAGLVLFGGITSPNYHTPAPNAQNLWQNIINYTANSILGIPYSYVWQPGAAVTSGITATTSGIYTVTVTSPSGCIATATHSVTINPAVTVVPSATPTSVCPGTSSTLSATGADTYTWMPGSLSGSSVSVSPIVNTTYTVTGTSTLTTCTSTAVVTVSVNNSPVFSSASATPSLLCPNDLTSLTASATETTGGTGPGAYTIASIPHNPVAPAGPTSAGPSGDDVLSGAVSLPFTFTFYGIPYNNVYLSTNGFITFDAGAGSGCCTGQVIPSATVPNNVIAFGWEDWNVLAGQIDYFTVGTSPNRKFVVRYVNAAWYSGGGTPMNGEIVLNESDQSIEIHGTSGGPLASNNSTAGIENSTGTLATAVPGKNSTSPWTWANEGWKFSQLVITPISNYAWSNAVAGVIASPTSQTTNANPPAAYTYTVTATGANTCTATSTVSVTMKPTITGTATATPTSICLGSSSTLAGNVPLVCGGNETTFVGTYAPANWTVTNINSNGLINTGGAPANIILTSGTNASAIEGYTVYKKKIDCAGTVTFNWAYTTPDIAFLDQPRYRVNSGTWNMMTGFSNVGASTQSGTQTITVAAGDTISLAAYTFDNDGLACTVTLSNFSAPAAPIAGFVNFWDALTGGTMLGASPYNATPLILGTSTYYAQFNSTTLAGCTNPVRIAVPVTVNALPVVTASPSTQTLCENANATVTGGGASSYAWSGGITDATPFAVTSSATYTVTGTDANLCTNTATAVVNMNALPTVTASPTTQTLCQNANATVTGGGASSYTWSGGITDATPFAVTSSATYTVTGTDANLCTNTATAVVNMNAAPTVTAGATPTTTCNNTVVTPTGSGASTYTWSGGLTDNTPFVATATATYTVTGTDGIGCSATSSVTVTVTPASGTLAPATSNQSQAHNDDFNVNYSDASCNLIATVDDGAGGNILGLTTATVNVDATAGVHNGQPFVRRWYQITPTSNGSADVILYINQADFNDYNGSVTAPYLPLPTSGNNSDPNIANIRITKNADAGLGNSPVVITPTVNWNGTYWELSFNTPSFSQFRIHSANPGNIPLPATITKFNGRKLSTSDMLTWTTASEQNNAYFNLQYATDGINFKTIAKVNSQAANGNSSSILNYSYEHMTPSLGHNYYRLEQVDIDNHATLNQQIVDLIWGSNGSTVSIYPNPTKDVLNIDLYTSKVQNTTVKVLDMSGRIIKQIQARSEAGMNQLSISLGDIASGIYTVQIFENDQLTQVSKVKKND